MSVRFAKQGNIGVVTVDNPPVNALSQAVRQGLHDAVAQGIADPDVAAMVIACAGRTFIAGADIREFGKPLVEPNLPEVIQGIEASPKPVVAAIHGTALGGGFEVALGCHYRVAVASAKVGLPEVRLGLLPGAGGTQRLPRAIGAPAALELIVSGTPVSAAKAKAAGAIDEIVEGELTAGAIAFAQRVVADGKPIPRLSQRSVTPPPAGFFDQFRNSIARKQRGFFAPFRCIDAVRAAVELPFAEGMQRERALFAELIVSPESKAQRHVFFAEREVARIPGLPEDTPVREVKQVGILGAGTMGGGIAMAFANGGYPVMLLEMSQENLDRGLRVIHKNYANSVAKGSLAQEEMDKRLARITPALSYEALKDADLIIEAVYEEMSVKKEAFGKLDAIAKPGAILASNTSYLNIDEIAQATKRPQDVIGTHFFSPANVMKLLENVRGAKSAPDVQATVMAVGKKIGKVAVMVGVCDGFVGNRMLAKRQREAMFLLEEGALPAQVDKVIYDYGLPMGPFAMSDLAGLDVGWRNRKANLHRLTPREAACDLLDKICEKGHYGQKTGSGFFKYDDQRNSQPDPEVDAMIVAHSAARGFTRRQISDQEILERCLYSMVNEGAKILEEGIAARPLDIDIVWIYGYGWPVYRGGPMFWADQVGLAKIYEAILGYREAVGAEYWEPAPLLERLAKAGKGFYSA